MNAVGVAPQGGQGQRGPPRLICLIHVCVPLQQHLQSLGVAVVRLSRSGKPLEAEWKL